ncbi:hypothetical protein HDU97_002060 [Phlyctochytrium planicorne]|nr:hypothetical protein HDU97_002060 [Phlyctochytrium planicorne]
MPHSDIWSTSLPDIGQLDIGHLDIESSCYQPSTIRARSAPTGTVNTYSTHRYRPSHRSPHGKVVSQSFFERLAVPKRPRTPPLPPEVTEFRHKVKRVPAALFERLHQQRPLHKVSLPKEMFERPVPPPAPKDFFERLAVPKSVVPKFVKVKEEEKVKPKDVVRKLAPIDEKVYARLAAPKYYIKWKNRPQRFKYKGFTFVEVGGDEGKEYGENREEGNERRGFNADGEEDEMHGYEMDGEGEEEAHGNYSEDEDFEPETATAIAAEEESPSQKPTTLASSIEKLKIREPSTTAVSSRSSSVNGYIVKSFPVDANSSYSQNLTPCSQPSNGTEQKVNPLAFVAWNTSTGPVFATLKRNGELEVRHRDTFVLLRKIQAQTVIDETLTPGPRILYAPKQDPTQGLLIGSITDLQPVSDQVDGIDGGVRFSTLAAWDSETLELLWRVNTPLASVSLAVVRKGSLQLLMVGYSNGDFEFRRLDTGAEVWDTVDGGKLGDGARLVVSSENTTIIVSPMAFLRLDENLKGLGYALMPEDANFGILCIHANISASILSLVDGDRYLALLSQVVESNGELDEKHSLLSIYHLGTGRPVVRGMLYNATSVAACGDKLIVTFNSDGDSHVSAMQFVLEPPRLRILSEAQLLPRVEVESVNVGPSSSDGAWDKSVTILYKNGEVAMFSLLSADNACSE